MEPRPPPERRRLARLGAACLVLAALAPGTAPALSSDGDQPITVEADRAEADDARRVTIYRGDVIIEQGTLRITGETVTIYYDQASEMTKLVSVGRPARFRQLPDGAQHYQTARAKRMEYYAKKDLIVLLGEAVYGQGPERIAADRIVYDSERGRVRADTVPAPATAAGGGAAAEKPRSRVRITIMPKNDKKKAQ